jgi:hypothetical protein
LGHGLFQKSSYFGAVGSRLRFFWNSATVVWAAVAAAVISSGALPDAASTCGLSSHVRTGL